MTANPLEDYKQSLKAWFDEVFASDNQLPWWRHNHHIDQLRRISNALTIEQSAQVTREICDTWWHKEFTAWLTSTGTTIRYQRYGYEKLKKEAVHA